MNNNEIIEQVRREFDIEKRECEHLCFEGCHVPEFLKVALLIKDEQTQEKVEALKELLRLACKPYVGEIGNKKLEYNEIVVRIDKIFKTSLGGKDE